jgi:hypothetical protein
MNNTMESEDKKLVKGRIIVNNFNTEYILISNDVPYGKEVEFCQGEYDFIMGVTADWAKVQDILKRAYNG